MSWKIYNGIKFQTSNIFHLHELMNKIREEAREIEKRKVLEYYGQTCCRLIDNECLKKTGKISPKFSAWKTLLELQTEVKTKGIQDATVDFSFSVIVFPFEGELFGSYYCVQGEYVPLIQKISIDYPWWDNADMPENVSEKDWNERERVWKAIFEKESIPALNGFLYEIVLEQTSHMPKSIEILQYLPSFEQRVNDIARDQLFDHFKKNNTLNNEGKIYSWFTEYMKYEDSEEGKSLLEDYKNRISKKLKRVITVEMLDSFSA